MNPIRTDISIRLDYDAKEKLKQIAHAFQLQLPEMLEMICMNFLYNPAPYAIDMEIATIKKQLEQLENKGYKKANLEIFNSTKDNRVLLKTLTISGIQEDGEITYKMEPIKQD